MKNAEALFRQLPPWKKKKKKNVKNNVRGIFIKGRLWIKAATNKIKIPLFSILSVIKLRWSTIEVGELVFSSAW